MIHKLFRRDRRGELQFEVDVSGDGSEFVAKVTRAVRIHAGFVPRHVGHSFPEQRGPTEEEALSRATAEIDMWITVFGAEEEY